MPLSLSEAAESLTSSTLGPALPTVVVGEADDSMGERGEGLPTLPMGAVADIEYGTNSPPEICHRIADVKF